MVRSAVADDSFLNYLTSLVAADTCTVGLILGQPTAVKDYVIHFARTPPYHGDGAKSDDKTTPPKTPTKFADISDAWVADHAKHATRMLPGGMYVLGIFVISQDDILTPFATKIKTMLSQIHRRLNFNEFLYGNPSIPEKLVLNYCVKTQSYSCKSYDVETSLIKPAEIKFQPKLSVKWLQIECKYELDQLFPIMLDKANWPLKKHMQDILRSINDNLKSGVFFFDGESKDGDDCLELVGKKRKGTRARTGHHEAGDIKPMQVTILLPCDGRNLGEPLQLAECGGQIRLTGHVASKLWLHPKATVNDASQAVIQDIARSLAARLEMHWDSLIGEEHGSPEDVSTIHEPPRRVLVTLPTGKVTLSDYLFPGEGPQEAQISLQELLDIKIAEMDAIRDIEGQADLTDLCSEGGLDAESDEILQISKATNKNIYFAGLGIAFLVLVISLLVHFIKNYT